MTIWIVVGIIAVILLMPLLKAMHKTIPRWVLIILLMTLAVFAFGMWYDLLTGRGG